MPDIKSSSEMPIGFPEALTQHPKAMNAFSHLIQNEKAHYTARAHQTSSKAEMQALIAELDHTRTP